MRLIVGCMTISNRLLSGICIGLVLFITGACRVEDAPPTPYGAGTYVVNAGLPGGNNGSISFWSRDSSRVSTDIFNAANGRSLAGTVRDYTEIDGKGVILVDNNGVGQDRVEIVEAGTFKSIATFQAPDVENPRYVIYAGPNKAYISCWDTTNVGGATYPKAGYILVLSLGSRTVLKKIPVAKAPEQLVLIDREVFVGSVGGERVLTVINADTDEVVQPGLDAGVNSSPIGLDFNGKLWAYSSSTNEMVRISPTNKLVETRIKVGDGTKRPTAITLSADKKLIYFVNAYADRQAGETYRFSINDTEILATVPFIRRYFAGLGSDLGVPGTDKGRALLYAATPSVTNQPGYVLRYQPNGALVDSIRADIAPTRFYFK